MGATTSMSVASIDAHAILLAIEPTNEIAQDTLVENTVKYSDRSDTKIVQIPSNKHCILIQQRIAKTPLLDAVPVFMKPDIFPNCEHFDICELTKILRDEYDGVVLTYDKLVYMAAGMDIFGSFAQVQVDELLSGSEKIDVIFDEGSWLTNVQAKKLALFFYDKTNDSKQLFDFSRYREDIKNCKIVSKSNKFASSKTKSGKTKRAKAEKSPGEEYNSILTIIDRCEKIFGDSKVEEKAGIALEKAKSKRYWDEHISKPLEQPMP